MSSHHDDHRNILQKAGDKISEVATDAKETIVEKYHDLTGQNTTEDKAARNVKDTVDDVRDKAKDWHESAQEKWDEFKDNCDQKKQTCSDSAQDMREKMGEKMHEGARKIEGH